MEWAKSPNLKLRWLILILIFRRIIPLCTIKVLLIIEVLINWFRWGLLVKLKDFHLERFINIDVGGIEPPTRALKQQLFTYCILGFALAEAMGLFALMMAFLLLYAM